MQFPVILDLILCGNIVVCMDVCMNLEKGGTGGLDPPPLWKFLYITVKVKLPKMHLGSKSLNPLQTQIYVLLWKLPPRSTLLMDK